jgi:hypothetical protein
VTSVDLKGNTIVFDNNSARSTKWIKNEEHGSEITKLTSRNTGGQLDLRDLATNITKKNLVIFFTNRL